MENRLQGPSARRWSLDGAQVEPLSASEPEITARLARMRGAHLRGADLVQRPLVQRGQRRSAGRTRCPRCGTMLRCAAHRRPRRRRPACTRPCAAWRRSTATTRSCSSRSSRRSGSACSRSVRGTGKPDAVPARPRRRGRDRRRSRLRRAAAPPLRELVERRRHDLSTSPPRSRRTSPSSASTPSSA